VTDLKKSRGYLALVLQTQVVSRFNDPPVDGPAISLTDADAGRIGMMSVFKTKTAARKVWGRGVKLHPVEFYDKPKES